MVKLKCANCGGKITAIGNEIHIAGNTARIKYGYAFRCDYCGEEFEENTTLPMASISVEQNIGTVEAGSTVIGLKIDSL